MKAESSRTVRCKIGRPPTDTRGQSHRMTVEAGRLGSGWVSRIVHGYIYIHVVIDEDNRMQTTGV